MSRTLHGIHPVQAALEAGEPVEKILISSEAKGGRIQQLLAKARKAGIRVQFVRPDVIQKKAGGKVPQGIVAFVAEVRWLELEELLGKIQTKKGAPFLVVLDEVEDPHNLGAIARSAEAFGADGLILPARRSAPLSAVAVKASAGALEFLPVARVGNLARALETLKEAGIWVVGADEKAEELVWNTDWLGPLAVVIGNEGRGLRRLIREKCDALVRIPLHGKTPSLNASVAAGIVCYEVAKQRTGRGRKS